VLLLLNIDDLGRAVRVTGVIKIARLITMEGRVDNVLLVKSEQVAITDALLFIDYLTFVGHFVADFLSNILNNYVVTSKILVSKKAISVDLTRSNLYSLWLSLAQSVLHRNR
jgi:hypothetical protein